MLKTYCFAWLAGLCLLLISPIAQAQRAGGVTTNASGGGGGPVALPAEETPWSHLIDSLTAHLDKSPIASGILYDRAWPLASLHAFNAYQADTSTNAHLRQAYLELWVAAYNRSLFRVTPDQFWERANRVARHDSVPLAVLDYQFHYLDSLAVRDGLVSLQNGVLYNVSAPSRSPYLLRNLVLAAPMVDTLRQYTNTFVLPAALLLGNRTRRVSSLTVDFNDGGANRSLLPGQALTITYPSSGRKVLWFIVAFNDGSTAQVRASFYVKVPTVAYRSEPIRLVGLDEVEASIPFQDYNSTTSLFGRGEVLAVLHNQASLADLDNGRPIRLRRPVIVMDGFDPGDQSLIFDDRSSLPEDKSVYNLLREKGILTLLDDQHLQRDLIILNFPVGSRHTPTGATTTTDIDGGADYVERNAFVLVELINRLKPLLAIDPATQQPYQFTIIGPSMGGLVSRYALAYMEKQAAAGATPPAGQTAAYWQHNTATWISFDAPHQGAVVPLADQAYLKFFSRMSAAAGETLVTNLYSPAAQQMLVHHVLASGTTPAGAPGFRDRFMQALLTNGEPGSLGYPVHVRRLALANGRLDGQGDPGGTPCGKMFDMDVKLTTRATIAATVGWLLFAPLSRQPTSHLAQCTARYAPAPNTSCTVFEGVLNYTIYGVSLVPPSYTYTPVFGRYTVNAASQGSYDLAPGGLRASQEVIRKQATASTSIVNAIVYRVYMTDVHPNHCFIPTASALGFQYQTMNSYQNTGSLPNPYTNLLTRNLVCDNEIPFDDFYAPAAANSFHVTVPDAGMQAFLVRELTPQVATPVFAAAPSAICLGAQATFSVASCPTRAGQPATTYNWTLSGPAVFAATNTQTLTGAGNSQGVVSTAATGTVTLTVVAQRAGAAASVALTKNVYVGDAYASVTTPSEVQKFENFQVALDQGNTTGPYAWSISPPYKASILNVQTATGTIIQVHANSAGQITITATGTDACTGASITASSPLTITTGGLRPDPVKPAAYPNPADDVLTLATPETKDIASSRTAVLYSAQGQEVRRTRPGQAQLPTTDLPTGLYYLLVEQHGRVTRSQIRVQH